MLNEILAIINMLIDRYEKSKKQATLTLLVDFCINLNGYVVKYIPALHLNEIEVSKLTLLLVLRNELKESASGKIDNEKTYNKCIEIYNLVMEFTNENW
jgi:hypothetical protein